jgi:hypothetical protein
VWGFVLCGCTAFALDNVPGLSLPGQKRVCIYVAAGVYFSQSRSVQGIYQLIMVLFFHSSLCGYYIQIDERGLRIALYIALYVWYLPRRSRLEQLVLILDACGPTVRG